MRVDVVAVHVGASVNADWGELIWNAIRANPHQRSKALATLRRRADTRRLSRIRRQRPPRAYFVSGGDPMSFIRLSLSAIVGGILFGTLAANAQAPAALS